MDCHRAISSAVFVPVVSPQLVLEKAALKKAEAETETKTKTRKAEAGTAVPAASASRSSRTAAGASVAQQKRVLKELKGIMQSPVGEEWGEVVVDAADMCSWKLFFSGPPSTVYEGGTWILTCQFPQDYPFRAPGIRFITPMYHCNVSADGPLEQT